MNLPQLKLDAKIIPRMGLMAQIASKQILVRDVDFNCDEATTVTGDSHWAELGVHMYTFNLGDKWLYI